MNNKHNLTDNNYSDNTYLLDSSLSQVDQNSEGNNTEISRDYSENILNEVLVYRQDVVKCSKYENLLGIAMEVAGDSDSEGSITDDNDDDDSYDDNDTDGGEEKGGKNRTNEFSGNDASGVDDSDSDDSLLDGQVRITWLDGSETTENSSDLAVVDRNFFHGDIVASASNPTGQLGLVIDVNIKVDLLSATGELIKDIPSRDLKHIRKFSVGDFVIHESWLGRVDEVFDNVTVLLDDGSVCKVVKADPLRLKPVSKPIIDNADCPYYPGQRVKAVSSSVFKTSRWPVLFKPNRLEGTVIKVTTASVIVYWISSSYLGVDTNSSTVPSDEQNPKNLTLLSCFSHANWQLGDWCLFPLSQQFISSVNDTIKSTDASESVEGCDSCLDHTDDTGGSRSTPDVPEPDTSNNILSIKSGHLINSDSPEFQSSPDTLLNGHITSIDLNLDDPRPQSSVESKADETQGNESNDLTEYFSCSSTSSVSKEPAHESWPTYRKKLRKVLFKRDKKCRKKDEAYEKALPIINTITNIDVVWQDGTIEFGLPSTSVIPIHTPNDNEFFPEQYVVEKASNEEKGSEASRIGVVRSVNAQDRTVCVRWLKLVYRPEEPREFDFEEIVSAYELDVHPDYDYCYGDVVVRLPSVSSNLADTERSALGQETPAGLSDTENDLCKEDVDENREQQVVSSDEACENNVSLPWVGNITGFQDGDIEVTWIDGMVSKVGPQEIYVVGRDDDEDSFYNGSGGDASWETVEEDEMDTLDIGEKEVNSQNAGDIEEKCSTISQEDGNSGRSGPLAVPLAAIDFVTKFATGLFSRARKQLDSSASNQINLSETEYQAENEVLEDILDDQDNDEESDVCLDMCATKGQNHVTTSGIDKEKIEDILGNGESVGMDDDNKEAHNTDCSCKFKHFDMTENPSDHHFLSHDDKTICGKKWVKKVQQEWSILEKNLPDAIYVRVFEDRMDLVRAVIIGACGTPYQDGLFFFDFHLPSEYPKVPPSAYYHSGGLRVNPNLYVDGKVCLSLLNTWTGKGNEVWDPSSSSILQVLVSLQGLVLNSKPYFNEAGYEKQVGTLEGEKNSVPYNENTYLLNLKSMIYLLRRPPMHFKDFVKDHFRRRGHYILKACEAYMAGCLIGSLAVDACMTEKSKEHSCSVGFKLTLAKILPRLVAALKEVGADCLQFEHLLNSENFAES